MNQLEGDYLPKAIGIGINDVRLINTGFTHPNAELDTEATSLAVALFCEGLDIPTIDFFRQFSPPTDIVPLEKENVTHHMRDHAAHVLVLSCVYMVKLQSLGIADLSQDDMESVLWAAVYHDAMRNNDTQDDDHGERIAQFIEADISGKTRIPDRLKSTVCTIIREHVPEDSLTMHPLTRIFKDVDNLLWIRTGDYDHHYIRNEVAHDLPPIAQALLQQTSIESKLHKDLFDAGLVAANTIGLLPAAK